MSPNNMPNNEELTRIIDTIFQHGQYSKTGCDAIDALCRFGPAGVDAMIAAMNSPPETSLHPRDVWDSIAATFWMLAKDCSNHLIDRMEDGSLDASWVYHALGNARGERSLQTLINGLVNENKFARWAAVESLLRRRSRRAVGPLIDRLRDRSSLVKSSVVFAMKDRKWLRRHDALPLLRRIRESKAMKQHSPGTWKCAAEVIELIESEYGSVAEKKSKNE